MCIIGFLLSADTGLYSTAALLLCSAVTVVLRRRSARAVARFLSLTAALSAVAVLVVNAWMGSALNFIFWRSSLAIAEGYRWFEPVGMSKADKHLVLATLTLGIVVFGWPGAGAGLADRGPDGRSSCWPASFSHS